MSIMQINLNYGEAGHDLLQQTIIDKKLDLVLLNEPYRRVRRGSQVTDASKKATILTSVLTAFLDINSGIRVSLGGV